MRATKLRHAPTEGARCTGPPDDSARVPSGTSRPKPMRPAGRRSPVQVHRDPSRRSSTMRTDRPSRRGSVLVAAIGGLAARRRRLFSSGGASTAPSAAAVASTAPSRRGRRPRPAARPTPSPSRPAPLGAFLTGEDGKTLYIFTPDSANKSTCTDACAPDVAAVHRRVERHAQGRRRRDRNADDLRPAGRHDAGRRSTASRCTTSPATPRPATRPARASAASGSSPRRPARLPSPAASAADVGRCEPSNGASHRGPFAGHAGRSARPASARPGSRGCPPGVPSFADGLYDPERPPLGLRRRCTAASTSNVPAAAGPARGHDLLVDERLAGRRRGSRPGTSPRRRRRCR